MGDRRFAPDFESEELTRRIIGAAIEVHRELGPGLLESSYEQCLWQELIDLGIPVQRQVELPIRYKGRDLDCGYRIDLLVEDLVVIELKSVEKILRIHEAQLMTTSASDHSLSDFSSTSTSRSSATASSAAPSLGLPRRSRRPRR